MSVKPIPALVVLALLLSGHGAAQAQAPPSPPSPPSTSPDSTPRDFAAGDVHFMTGMIYHHAQAVLIAGWAPTHEASPSLRALCDRIVVGQADEIHLMQRWLRDRRKPVPDQSGEHSGMPGMDHPMMMPGMLTPDQLAELDRARGREFDRLFLTFMIQHHRGAITMVNELFAQGAGEQENVYRFASGVFADQTTEIARMQKMLAALLFQPTGQ